MEKSTLPAPKIWISKSASMDDDLENEKEGNKTEEN
jgi:hypothetical protein